VTSGQRPLLLAFRKNSPDLTSTPLVLPLATMDRIKVMSFGNGSLLSREKSLNDSCFVGSIFWGMSLRNFCVYSLSWHDICSHNLCHNDVLLNVFVEKSERRYVHCSEN
jgi:hypothetical protein